MNKKNFSMVTIIILIVLCIILVNKKSDENNYIQIGSILSLSGDASSWGETAQNGISLAVEDINKQGGVLGKKVTIVYEDDQSRPTQTVVAFKKLTEVDGIKFVIGPSWTKLGLAIKDLVDDEVVISPSLGGAKFNEGNKYIFNTRQHDYILSENLAEYVYNKGHKIVAVLSVNDPYNKEQTNAFKNKFEDIGGDIKYIFEPAIEQKDVRTDLLKAKDDPEIDALVATTGGTPQTALFAIQLKELNIEHPVYSVTIDQTRIDESKGATDGWIYLSSFTPSQNFSERYLRTFGNPAHISSDSAYDAMMLLSVAIKETESLNPELIQEYLNNIKTFSGVSGNLVADGEGAFTKNYEVLIVHNGKPEIFE